MTTGFKEQSLAIMNSPCLLIVTIFSASMACFAEPAKALVGCWLFDEGQGTILKDASTNGNHAAIPAGMEKYATWIGGRNGKALSFTGNPETRGENGCVLVPSMGVKYDWSKGMTIEAWIKLAATAQKGRTYEIVSNTADDRGPGFRFFISYGALSFTSGEGGTGMTWGAVSRPSQTRVELDEWHHIAGTYDGSVFKVYLDGKLAGESAQNLALTKGRDDIYIGSYNGGYAYGFEGIIDEVRIYNTVLTETEVLRRAKGEM